MKEDDDLIGKLVYDNISEVRKAAQRIGKSEEDLMRWVLKLALQDLSSLSAGDWMNLQSECSVFMFPYLLDRSKEPEGEYIARRSHIGPETPEEEIYLMFPPLSMKAIKKIQSFIKETLDDLFSKDWIELPLKAITLVLDRPHDKGGEWSRFLISEDSEDVLRYNFFTMLETYSQRVSRCPECQVFFLADRRNQSYCSIKHQNYAAVRKYRKSKGLITGRKRGRPRKQDTPKKKGGA